MTSSHVIRGDLCRLTFQITETEPSAFSDQRTGYPPRAITGPDRASYLRELTDSCPLDSLLLR